MSAIIQPECPYCLTKSPRAYKGLPNPKTRDNWWMWRECRSCHSQFTTCEMVDENGGTLKVLWIGKGIYRPPVTPSDQPRGTNG